MSNSESQVNENLANTYRRKFLAQSAAVAGLAIAPGIVLNQVAHAKADAVALIQAKLILVKNNKHNGFVK